MFISSRRCLVGGVQSHVTDLGSPDYINGSTSLPGFPQTMAPSKAKRAALAGLNHAVALTGRDTSRSNSADSGIDNSASQHRPQKRTREETESEDDVDFPEPKRSV
jgi:hypothetical protein